MLLFALVHLVVPLCLPLPMAQLFPVAWAVGTGQYPLIFFDVYIAQAGNTKGGSITVLLNSVSTGLESAAWLLTFFVFICKTDSKPVKQEVNSTVILPPLVFPGTSLACWHYGENRAKLARFRIQDVYFCSLKRTGLILIDDEIKSFTPTTSERKRKSFRRNRRRKGQFFRRLNRRRVFSCSGVPTVARLNLIKPFFSLFVLDEEAK
jgi:hypothetical protein